MKTHSIKLMMISTLTGSTNLAGYQSDEEDIRKMEAEFLALAAKMTKAYPPNGPGRPGRQVAIVGIADEDTHAFWVAAGCPHLNDLDNWTFASAVEASRWLGCNNNDVGAKLSAARKRGEEQATVRGLIFEFAKSV